MHCFRSWAFWSNWYRINQKASPANIIGMLRVWSRMIMSALGIPAFSIRWCQLTFSFQTWSRNSCLGRTSGKLKCLFYPPGISAGDLLIAMKPRLKTYLGLPEEQSVFQSSSRFSLINWKSDWRRSRPYHKALSRSERKELTFLSMIVISKDWTIENRKMIVIVRPPLEAEKVKVELERRQKLITSRRL